MVIFKEGIMTQLLERAFSQASLLPEIQQNMLAKWIMEELLAEKMGHAVCRIRRFFSGFSG